MKELGIGMIGYGFIGKVHTYGYLNIPLFYDSFPIKIKLVGVCTAHKETGEKAKREAGYEFATTNFRDLLKRKDVDLIDCSTPNYLHREILLAALKNNKHIYCDKPMVMDLKEAKEVLKVEKGSKEIHQMAFEYRFIPALMRAKQLIEEGFLGKVFHFRGCYLHSGYINPKRPMSWRLEKKKAGAGALFDLGAHIIDLIRWFLGDYQSLLATSETLIKERPKQKGGKQLQKVDVDDLSFLQVRMKSGALGTLEFSRLATGTNDEFRIQIYGEKGAIYFNSLEPNFLSVYDVREKGEPIGGLRGFKKVETVQRYPTAIFPGPKFAIGWLRYHIESQYNFLMNIVQKRKGKPSLKDGYKVQEVMESAYLSSKKKKWINLPL